MDPDLISEKLESLRRCLQRVQKKCPATPEELMEDPDLQDIISLNLTRAVQLSVDTVATGVHPPQDDVASGSNGFPPLRKVCWKYEEADNSRCLP